MDKCNTKGIEKFVIWNFIEVFGKEIDCVGWVWLVNLLGMGLFEKLPTSDPCNLAWVKPLGNWYKLNVDGSAIKTMW